MLFDLKHIQQPPIGSQMHWAMLTAVMADAFIYGPLRIEITKIVAAAIACNPRRPAINSRLAGADALVAVGSEWHAAFPRHFPNFPNGAARGVFGMALWHYLVSHPDTWYFSGI